MTEALRACRIARWSGSDNAAAAGEEEDGAEAAEAEEGEEDVSAGWAAETASMSALCPPDEENAACRGWFRRADHSAPQSCVYYDN